MRKEQYNTPDYTNGDYPDFVKKENSLMDNFIQWFHNFLDSAE